jgi:hypothetical protein
MMNAFDNLTIVLPQTDAFSKAWENPVERLLVAKKLGKDFNIDMDEYQDARSLVDANFASVLP